MRALICTAFGGPEGLMLGDLPEPEFGPDEILITVAAAGVSFVDTLMIRNLHQNKHRLPFAPGMEVAGTVREVGRDVEGIGRGQRVMALVYDGGFAAVAVAKAQDVFALPDTLSFARAAALGSTHLTAHAALRWEGRLVAGERLLVLGAGGGVGLAAVEVGKRCDARVVAAAGSAGKLAAARDAGADDLIDYEAGSLKEQVRAVTGGAGVDVVLDPVGGRHHEDALSCLEAGGRYLVVGFAGGAIPRIAANHLLVKNRAALGFVLMHYRRRRADLLRRSWQELTLPTDGSMPYHPRTTEIALRDAPAALQRLMARESIGRFVIDMGRAGDAVRVDDAAAGAAQRRSEEGHADAS